MLVEILDTDRRGRLERRTFLCEAHARVLAGREGLRWPEPHEHSARTLCRNGDRTDVRVMKAECAAECEHCADGKNDDQRFDELTAWMLGERPE